MGWDLGWTWLTTIIPITKWDNILAISERSYVHSLRQSLSPNLGITRLSAPRPILFRVIYMLWICKLLKQMRCPAYWHSDSWTLFMEWCDRCCTQGRQKRKQERLTPQNAWSHLGISAVHRCSYGYCHELDFVIFCYSYYNLCTFLFLLIF